MKRKLLNVVTVACLLLFPIFSFGQIDRPIMGTTENFVMFTTNGALTNQGASQFTLLTGDVGSVTAPIDTELGNIDGTIYAKGDTEGVTAQATSDLNDLYKELNDLEKDYDLPTLLGGPDHFPPGVYTINASTTLNGELILDADGVPDALFILRVTAGGTFSTTAGSSILLVGGAQACNVFWHVEGAVSIGTNNFMKGTIVSPAAIDFAPGTEFEGRALSTEGAITINNGETGFLAQKPIGCGSPFLTGPEAPDLKTAGCFALFTGNGSMVNSETSTIVGDVGTNVGLTSGFELPTTVDGTVYPGPTDETAQAASDLGFAFDHLVDLPNDIVLLAPALFGYDLILTPHTYVLSAETHLTGDLYLDAQGNPDAVFVIKVDAAFFTAVGSKVLLINEAKAENVYWKVTGAVSIEGGSFFEGTIVATGAVELKSAAELNGRALTKTGDFSTDAIKATSPGCDTAPQISTHPLNQEVCEGGSASFTVKATGTDLTYQWRKGDVVLVDIDDYISGVNTATLTIDPVTLSDAATDYNVVVTGSVDPFTATSDNASLIVNTAPEITLQPANQVACDGGTVIFTVEATGTDLTYQWRKGEVDLVDGAAISGATTATLTINNVSDLDEATDYNVVISGACEPDVTSSNASLVISDEILIVTQPADQVGCEHSSVSFTVEATGAGLEYQWRKGTVDLVDGTEISGVTTATLTIDPVALTDAATDYNVVISGECGLPVTSNNASLTVSTTAPDIDQQPANQVVCEGDLASFTVVATGDGLTYQWRKGEVDLEDIDDHISGVNTATLTIDPVTVADAAENYNVVVTGACEPDVISDNASLTVDTAPEITIQPADQVGCEAGSVSFTVEATGADLEYQWRKGTDDLVDNTKFSGVNTATLTIDPVALTDAATDYNVVISGDCGLPVTSNNASLTVSTTAPDIDQQPANQVVCEGDLASFTVVATGDGLTYQWRKGEVDLEDIVDHISGVNTATLTINSVTVADAAENYNVVVTGTCEPDVISDDASLTVNTAPEITIQPWNQLGCEGGSVSFSVTATGTDLEYQWRKGTVDLVDNTKFSGATSATLTIYSVDASDEATDYNVIISGLCGSDVISDNASLVIGSSPEITVQPTNQTECAGGSVSFSVTATGSNLTYQWRIGEDDLVDGEAISGVNTATLTIDPVTVADAAVNYNVVVSGACTPSVISNNASLTVNTAPEITIQPANQTGCVGSLVSFNVEATGTGLTYQWRKGAVDLVDGEAISGATTASLTIDPVDVSDEAPNYNVVVTGTCGSPLPSNNASLVVNTSPDITEQPTDQTVNVGSVASFSVTAIGTDLTYQWRKGSVDLTVSGNILGATSSTLIIDPVSEADAAEDYNVVVSGGCDPAVTSVDVTLTVLPTGITLIDSENQLTLYPNPFKESVNIRLNDELYGEKYELLIYNALGELVAKTRITEQITVLETGQFASGIYFYQVIGKDKVIQSGKLIKQK